MFRRLLEVLGFAEEEEGEFEEEEFEGERHLRVVGGMKSISKQQLDIIIVKPVSFEEARSFADNLKDGKIVIMNLEDADKDTAKRFIDFASGLTYALNGHLYPIGKDIFLFTSGSVKTSLPPGKEGEGKFKADTLLSQEEKSSKS